MSSSTVGVGADDLVTGEAVALDLPHAGLGLRICSGLIDLVIGYRRAVVLPVARLHLGRIRGRRAGRRRPHHRDHRCPGRDPDDAGDADPRQDPGTPRPGAADGSRRRRPDPVPSRGHAGDGGRVEIYGCLGMPALLCAVFNRRGKRFGDLLAGTYVVRDRQRVSLPPPPQMPQHLAAWAAGADIAPLPDSLAATIRQFLSRTGSFAPHVREELAHRLLAEASPYMAPAAPPGNHPEWVLMAVLAERRSRDAARLERDQALREKVVPPDHLSPGVERSAEQARVARLDDLLDDREPLVERDERRLHRVDRHPAQVLEGPARLADEQAHLPAHARAAHQPVVGVDRDPETQPLQERDRVQRNRVGRAGLHVAARAHLQRDAHVADVCREAAQVHIGWVRGDRRGDVVSECLSRTRMSSTMRTPWPSRSAPHHWIASQMLGSPKASPAWMVKWAFSRRRYSNASRCRVGGNPASAPAMSKPATPSSR